VSGRNCHGTKRGAAQASDQAAAFEKEDGSGENQVTHRTTERKVAVQEESSYVCDACGEEIVIPVDVSAGESQQYVEDCPVCCRPRVVHVEIDDAGDVRVWSEPE
jgi:predicted RNA-binding Zn-ribbon protein involved in translation (DUF1610 family)